MKINKENKVFYDSHFESAPKINPEYCIEWQEDENGSLIPAIPLNYDPDIQEFGAVKDLIEKGLKEHIYKVYHIGHELNDNYSGQPLQLYDVVFLLSEEWKEPLFFTILKAVKNTDNGQIAEFVNITEDGEKIHTVNIKNKHIKKYKYHALDENGKGFWLGPSGIKHYDYLQYLKDIENDIREDII